MNTPLQFNSNHLQSALSEKLQPSRFPRMSRVMAGIVGFIVEADFTEPPSRTSWSVRREL